MLEGLALIGSPRKATGKDVIHHKTNARTAAIQFLYQCECERLYYFSSSHFDGFSSYQNLGPDTSAQAMSFCHGVLNNLKVIDEFLSACSTSWSLPRMASMDRCVLRLATHELLASSEPTKVILNEAIELAKIYGTENSGKFVNGILDEVASKINRER